MASKGSKLAFGTIIAALAGYVAGLLTAPKSGKETRKDIKDTAVKTKSEAEKQLKKLHSELSELITKGKTISSKLKSTGKKELDKALAVANTAREKARTMLSAVHEGDADDKDLQKAIDEVNSAISHLKTYINKK